MTIFNYTVNYVDVLLVAVFVLITLIGCKRGIIISIVNFIRSAVGLFLCFYLSGNLAQPVYDSYVKQRALDAINEKIVTSSNVDEIITNFQSTLSDLPSFITNGLDTSAISNSGDDIASALLTNVFEPIILAVIKAAVFIAVFLLFFIATGLIVRIAKKRSKKREAKRGKKSALKKTDMLFGTVFGALKAAVIVFAITSILIYSIDITADKGAFFTEASNSGLLNMLDSINPFNAITEGLI